ncbi:hypothetical protein H4R33_005172 [Dimargaris cristalligena]|nr:hypothetical protein H4R33_005172 [Dimargaris cristalligena]
MYGYTTHLVGILAVPASLDQHPAQPSSRPRRRHTISTTLDSPMVPNRNSSLSHLYNSIDDSLDEYDDNYAHSIGHSSIDMNQSWADSTLVHNPDGGLLCYSLGIRARIASFFRRGSASNDIIPG